MGLFPDTDGDPRATAAQMADVLAWYGALGDAARGNPVGLARRRAGIAVSLAKSAELDDAACAVIGFAGLLRSIGTIGNPAARKSQSLPERLARMELWDIPAQGARICSEISALPEGVAGAVRWQAESWDGTGHPDQLRWHGIPRNAGILAIADAYALAAEPDDALSTIAMQSGRAFGPESVSMFTRWFHRNAMDDPPFQPAIEALCMRSDEDPAALLDTIADRIDAHNGTLARWRRVAHLAHRTAELLAIDAAATSALALAARLYGSGELTADVVEDSQFDPLARLGIDARARNAQASAEIIDANATLGHIVPILSARSEWFDGTGKPHGLKHGAIPIAAAILAASIAYDASSRGERIEDASGTQFDPKVVRVLLEVARATV